MGIIHKTNDVVNRKIVFDYLKKKKLENPDYQVIDIGGGANPWCDKYVDAYADFKKISGKPTFVGDLNTSEVWKEIGEEKWDFCVCTHLLEDIRDPGFVIVNILKNCKAGFIAVPNKHTEVSPVESRFYAGYCHHRWIFTISEDDVLKMVSKMPILNYFIPKNRLYHILFSIPPLKRFMGSRRSFWPGEKKLNWVEPRLNDAKCELGFLWEECFDFEFINYDYAGDNYSELANLYIESLKDGI